MVEANKSEENYLNEKWLKKYELQAADKFKGNDEQAIEAYSFVLSKLPAILENNSHKLSNAYVNKVVNNLLIDYHRTLFGKERLPDWLNHRLGKKIFRYHCNQKLSIKKIIEKLQEEQHQADDLNRVKEIVLKIESENVCPKRERIPPDQIINIGQDDEQHLQEKQDSAKQIENVEVKEFLSAILTNHTAVENLAPKWAELAQSLRLTDRERLVINLRWGNKPYKVQQIAKILNITERSVYNDEKKALNKIKTVFEQFGLTLDDFI